MINSESKGPLITKSIYCSQAQTTHINLDRTRRVEIQFLSIWRQSWNCINPHLTPSRHKTFALKENRPTLHMEDSYMHIKKFRNRASHKDLC